MTKILVVDDERDAADSLHMLFEAMGHQCRVSYQGEQAVRVAADFLPHIIFLDLLMPVLDGFGAARAIRAAPDTDHPFIVALSGLVGSRIDQQVKDAGFDLYVRKPADTNELLYIVGSLAGQRHKSAPFE